MSSDTLKIFFNSVSELYKGKSVGNSTDCDISSYEYMEMYSKELTKLNDDDLINLYFERLKSKGKFFNTFIQVWYNCINCEMKKRNLNYNL